MGTKAATFTAKIRNLKDYHSRLINNISPLPSGVDIANTLKYFSQTLLSVLKDVPFNPSELFGHRHGDRVPLSMYGHRQRDSVHLSLFPNLNYSGLYEAVMNIIDVVPLIQTGQHALGDSVLNVLGCLVPFLENDLQDTLPYTVSSTLAVFPDTLHKEIVDLLCTNLLPITLGYDATYDNPTYATESTSAIIMMVFQYMDRGEYHSQVMECLMSMKRKISKDILSVIAFGPPSAKAPAVNHLFYYWPQLNPALTDKREIHYKYTGWTPVSCQRESCPNAGNVKAIKVCLDPSIALECGDRPPPLYVCGECAAYLHSNSGIHFLVDLIQPLDSVALVCENKNCKSANRDAICSCFSKECIQFNSLRPMRYCRACHHQRHVKDSGGAKHVFQLSMPEIWTCEPDLQNYLTEAIVSLLKEAQPLHEKRTVEMGEERVRSSCHLDEDDSEEGEVADERKLLSRYGVWLLVELCPAREDINVTILGRLLAMLFQWFDATAYLPDDNVGSALEKLKPEYVRGWIQEASKNHLEVVLSCLLPHPPEYAKVGGYWDTLASRTSQIKEGLNRLFCLVPYDIITFQVWDYVMPFWLEAIRTEVPEAERHELKVLLCKTFDMDMSPLPFSADKVYQFMTERFEDTGSSVQEQNLGWLQILSSLGILIPLNLMLKMFQKGVESLSNPPPIPDPPPTNPASFRPLIAQRFSFEDYLPGTPRTPAQQPEMGSANGVAFNFDKPGDGEQPDKLVIPNTTCVIMMLDVLLKQIELHESLPHLGIYNATCQEILKLLTSMLNLEWDGKHTCFHDDEVNDCLLCEVSSLWYQLHAQVMEFIAPRDELKLPVKDLPKVDELHYRKHNKKTGDDDESPEPEPEFDMDSLPVHLHQLLALLKALDKQEDADSLFFLLKSLKLLCLHAECLNHTISEHGDFIKYCLKKLMLPNLWKLLQAEHSQIAALCVPLLLHCLTLPSGADVFWNLVEDDFNNEDWKARFCAVEKVTVLARLVVPRSFQNNQQIMTSLAHSFCHLIGSLNDINSAVVQRATLYLETIKVSAIKCMRQCLEFQFDSVINDRTMVLRKVHLLDTVLRDSKIFSWEFFLNRFDTLCLEAQLDLEHTGDITSLQDLHSSDRQSDHFLRKINRARFALARTDSIRSVSFSVYAKPPYRRAASVPMHLLTKTLPNQQAMKAPFIIKNFQSNKLSPDMYQQDSHRKRSNADQQQEEKDKSPYTRQQSAPQFRSRGSRFGLGMFSNYMFPGGHLREYTDEESNFAALLQRAMDLEGVDRETLHHLVTLLMKYMVYSNQYDVMDDRSTMKAQNIVLRHLNVLLGYNQTERAFSVPPYKLRYSAVFNAYISGLPAVLDKNYELGNLILPVSMSLLQYCPSPQRYASDFQPPNYTLWYLDPHTRQAWLMSLLVILYKYQYNTSPASGTVHTMVQLAINTVDAQLHRCKNIEEAFGPVSPMVPRTRDTSNVSVGDLENIIETDTPPQSPTDSQHSAGETVTISVTSPSSTTVHYRKRDGSEKTEETDLESVSTTSKVTSPAQVPAPPPPPSPPSSPVASKPPSPERRPRSPPAVGKTGTGKTGTLLKGKGLPLQAGDDSQHKGGGSHSTKRTLEQSVEEYMMEHVSSKSSSSLMSLTHKSQTSIVVPPTPTPAPAPAPPEPPSVSPEHKPQDVDQKIAEQIEQFESQSDVKKRIIGDVNLKGPAGPEVGHDLLQRFHGSAGTGPLWDKPHGLGIERFETVLEEVKETEEESLESPKKLTEEKIAAVEPTIEEVPDDTTEGSTTHTQTTALSDKVTGSETDQTADKADAQQTESDLDESPSTSPGPQPRIRPHYRQKKARRAGVSSIDLQKLADHSSTSDRKSPTAPRKSRRSELKNKTSQSAQKRSMSALRATEQILVDRCPDCHTVLEQYDEDTVSLSIVCLATYIHREPGLAAPMLLEMLQVVARIASSTPYPWQADVALIVPGNSVSVARQFLRCTLHQLAPNGIFPQIFMTELEDCDFLKTMAMALMDFSDLNSYSALQLLLEGINEMKNVSNEQITNVVNNLAMYMDYIGLETSSPTWSNILTHFDVFFRRLPTLLPNPCDIDPVLKIMISVLKIPGLTAIKAILEPFSKLLSFTIQHCSFKLQQLVDICCLCGRAFTKERDKMFLSRCIIFELTQALKFKTALPDDNLVLMVQWLVMDAGGTIGPTNIVEELSNYSFSMYNQNLMSTNAAECMKQHIGECVEFISDIHTINKVKANTKAGTQNLNEDTLGSLLKCAMAQYVALEFTKIISRDSRAIGRHLPWLYHPPSSLQQGPREFTDCVGHIRLLSWLMLGALTHTAVMKDQEHAACQPFSLEASSYMADHIMVIMTGFAEQSKMSVLHMSSLFHAFILCQLWTMYCESYASLSASGSEAYLLAHGTIMDFWGRVTPGILQLLSHSKVLAEMVNLHFLGLMEALQECNSTVLSKLFPMWTPILFSHHSQLPGHMQVRLQICHNWEPKEINSDSSQLDSDTLLKWLKRLQFKLGQIEVQSSQATQLFIV